MRVFVSGDAGFIGSRLRIALEARGHTVIGADKADAGAYDLSRPRASDWVYSRLLAEGIDVIAHLAGSCSTPGSVARPLETFNDTVVTAVNVLEGARRADVPIVVTSSVKARDGLTPYGASKRMVEAWATEYRVAYQLPVIINRPGTVYGPGQEGSLESGWIAWFLEAKRRGIPVVINGNGSATRDLLHVVDYVELLLKQLEDPQKYDTGEIFDVGGGWDNAVSVLQIAQHLGLNYSFGPPRYGDVEVYVGVNDVPDWGPTVHWRDGLDLLTSSLAA